MRVDQLIRELMERSQSIPSTILYFILGIPIIFREAGWKPFILSITREYYNSWLEISIPPLIFIILLLKGVM